MDLALSDKATEGAGGDKEPGSRWWQQLALMNSRLRLRVVGSGSMPWYISCSSDQLLRHTNLLIPAFTGLDGSWLNTTSLQDLEGRGASRTSNFLDSPPPPAPGNALTTLWSPHSRRLPVFSDLITHREREGLWVGSPQPHKRLPVFQHLCGESGPAPEKLGTDRQPKVTVEQSKPLPEADNARDEEKLSDPPAGGSTEEHCANAEEEGT
ncbi:hypothetical protein NDU88_001856 [Pleurodeles waltl]|uniref:Uncharacterized protein n=1 Tax=Pleurodeles waltl TaxID=8319 RepID=A0AAV7U944_PLEWA|nr:hypothetical protein NDU88_001856 [Pleurodeles waltl]